MKAPKNLLLLTIAFVMIFDSAPLIRARVVEPQREADRVRIVWPSNDPSTESLQSTIDAAPAGATIQIREGVYRINSIFLRKRLVIVGAGSGRRSGRGLTHFIGPPPQRVIDERGSLILPAEAVVGMFNCIAADVTVQGLKITGSDAAIVTKNDRLGNSGVLQIKDVMISNAGRGVLSLSSGGVSVDGVSIQNVQFHGISIKAPIAQHFLTPFLAKETFISNPQGAGMYFENVWAFVTGAQITSAQEGGIVCFLCRASIASSILSANERNGILLVSGQPTSFLFGNLVQDTLPYRYPECLQDSSCRWGDGVTLVLSKVTALDNTISNNSRAGLSNFGGQVEILNNTFMCSGFDLEGEDYVGQSFTFTPDQLSSGCACGCPNPTNGTCLALSTGIDAPPPVSGP